MQDFYPSRRAAEAEMLPRLDPVVHSDWSDGAPITCVFPPGQVQAYSRDVMAVSGAPHPRAAKLFVTWLLSQEGQTLFQKLVQQDSLRPDVPALKQEGRPAKIDWWVPDAAVIQKDQKGILARYQAALGG